MQGKIVKGISGFYYVHVVGSGIYECKAKGIFRRQDIKPLVGDNVELAVISEEDHTGNIASILPRQNMLIRPAVANVDQALLIFAAASPEPNFRLMDRFLIMMAYQKIPVLICFNKCDLVEEHVRERLRGIYGGSGSRLLFVSAKEHKGLEALMQELDGRTTTVAGPSGVGKSSIINLLAPGACMETGEISRKIQRGRHTTRHAELIHLSADGYIMDTPGFSTMYLPEIEKEELQQYYPEFASYEPECRFQGCSHITEPECGVKQALQNGNISSVRYENYCSLYTELKERKRY